MTSPLPSFEHLTDAELLAAALRLAERERAATVDLLRCLIEVDARRLYCQEGCSSLFTYCTQVLHLAEGAAYNRIEAARAARRFPVVLEALAAGDVTLTSVRLLAPHLTVDNHDALLAAARHQRKRDVELLIARLAPKAPVPTIVRKLPSGDQAPTPRGETVASAARSTWPTTATRNTRPDSERSAVPCAAATTADASGLRRPRPASVAAVPMSANDYKLQVTISRETFDKLGRARDLLRHSIPDGNIATILDRALTLLLADVDKRRCAATLEPRPLRASARQTRHIPAAVKREVWRRDQGQCAYATANRRCTETAFLEFHHVVPYVDGGAATVANIELRCRSHNQYEARRLFGPATDMVREPAAFW